MMEEQLFQRSILFETPKRIIPPLSWTGHIPFAFFLIDQLRPNLFVELGVHTGNSYNAFCQAVKTLNTQTTCYGVDTWQGDEHAGFYPENIYVDLFAYQQQEYHEFSQLMRMTFDEALEYFADHSIDLLHIDGCHRYSDVRYDFEAWLPKVSDQGVVLFHDTQVRTDEFGVWRLWEELSAQYPSFEFRHSYGLGVLAVGKQVEHAFLDLLQEFSAMPHYQNLFARFGETITLAAENKELTETLRQKEERLYQLIHHYYTQLFIDTGLGFNATQAITLPLQRQARELEFDLSAYHDLRALRFDPLNDVTALHLDTIQLVAADGSVIPIETYQINACYRNGNNLVFNTPNPQIIFDSPVEQAQKLVISLEYIALGAATYPYILQQKDAELQQQAQFLQAKDVMLQQQARLIQAMENTLSWKLTTPLRTIRNSLYLLRTLRIFRKILYKGRFIIQKSHSVLASLDHVELFPDALDITGWALSHQGQEGIERIDVYLDHQYVGSADYGTVRPDVERVYPAVKDSGYSGFQRHIELSTLQISDIPEHDITVQVFHTHGNSMRLSKQTTLQTRKFGRRREMLDPYAAYLKNNQIPPHVLALLAKTSKEFMYKPLISILMPVYNVEARWLKTAIESVKAQSYPHWELCIADDASSNQKTLQILKMYEQNPRIKIVFRSQNGHICAATNSAADLAEGEFVAFMDNDDLLPPHALFEIVRLLQTHPDTDLIYSDEDKIDSNDRHYDPQFKPDWSPELFLSYNYINHFTCIRRTCFESAGKFRTGYEGAQDYDLLWRVIERTKKIRHIPKILYHWRAIQGSTAMNAKDKPVMHTSFFKGLQEHLERQHIETAVYQPDFAKRHTLPIAQCNWPDNGPSVTILIVPSRLNHDLNACLDSLLTSTTYTNYQIVLVSTNSKGEDLTQSLEHFLSQGVRIEKIDHHNEADEFSLSRLYNWIAQKVTADYVLFFDETLRIVEPQWLSRLVGYATLPGVGATGAKIVSSDKKTIRHAGLLLGMHDGLRPDYAFFDHSTDEISYYFMADVARNVSAVSGACLLTRRADFLRIEGFNEQDFPFALCDVDYCIRLGFEGLRTIYVAGAEVCAQDDAMLRVDDHPVELSCFRRKYPRQVDLYYSPNLSKIDQFTPGTDCGLIDYQEYRKTPLKVVIFTHDLELKGAPKAMYDIAVGLHTQFAGKMLVKTVSPVPGPFQSIYEQAGIECQVIDQGLRDICIGWENQEEYARSVQKIQEFFQEVQPHAIITNTVFSFYVVQAARLLNIPAVWVISESLTQAELEQIISDVALHDCVRSFADAYRVVFGSAATRDYYQWVNSQNNFHVIHNSVDREAIDHFIETITKEEARQKLAYPAGKKVALMVATICERKGQKILLDAAKQLRDMRNDFCVYLVGATTGIENVYQQELYDEIETAQLSDIVKVISESRELFWYYRASDIFVFTSHAECYPIAIVEATAFGLPVVAVPCQGVKEQIRPGINGLFFEDSNITELVQSLTQILDNEQQGMIFGKHSRALFESGQTYEEMISTFAGLIVGAWIKGVKTDNENDVALSTEGQKTSEFWDRNVKQHVQITTQQP